MSNNKLYQQLAQAAQQESMDFDQGAMWAALESQLDKKRRPFGFFILLFGAAISIGLAGLWFVNNSNNQSTTNNSTYEQPAEASTAFDSDKNPKQSNEALLATSALDKGDETNTTEQSTTVENTVINNRSNSATETEINTTTNTSNQRVSHSNKAASTATSELNTRSVIKNNKINKSKNLLTQKSTPTASTIKNIFIENNQPSATSIKTPTTPDNVIAKSNNQNSPNAILTSLSTAENKNNSSNKLEVNRNPIAQLDYKSISLFEVNQNGLTYQPLADKRDWSRCEIKKPWHFLVEAYAGYGHPLMKHEAKLDASAGYLTDWEEAQSPVGGFQAGAALVVQSPSGFEITGGLEYQNVVQKIESSSTTRSMVTRWDPMAYYTIDINGNRIWVADSVTSVIITSEKRINEIRHRLMNIPIKIGYVAPFGDWNIGAHAGVTLHLSHVVEGVILQDNGTYLEIDKNNSELVYKKDLGLSYTADIHIGRQISDNLELFIRPEFRYHTDSWTSAASAAHPISTKIQLAQMQAGVRYLIDFD